MNDVVNNGVCIILKHLVDLLGNEDAGLSYQCLIVQIKKNLVEVSIWRPICSKLQRIHHSENNVLQLMSENEVEAAVQ